MFRPLVAWIIFSFPIVVYSREDEAFPKVPDDLIISKGFSSGFAKISTFNFS